MQYLLHNVYPVILQLPAENNDLGSWGWKFCWVPCQILLTLVHGLGGWLFGLACAHMYMYIYIYLLSLPWYSLSPTDRHYRNPYKCFSDPFSRNQRNPNSRCEQSGRIGLAGVYEEAPVRVLSVSFHLHIPPLYYITQLQPLQAAPSSLFHCICGVMLFKSFSF